MNQIFDTGAAGDRRAHPPPEPTPWAAGTTVVAMVAVLTTVGIYAFGTAMAQVHPLLSVAVNVVAVGCVLPTAWRWRSRPVVRWVLAGAGLGVLAGWLGLLAGVF